MARKNVGLTQAELANKLGEYHSFIARLEPWGCRGFARGHAQSITKLPSKLGGIDVLVNNAAHQASFKSIDDITDHEWECSMPRRGILSCDYGVANAYHVADPHSHSRSLQLRRDFVGFSGPAQTIVEHKVCRAIWHARRKPCRHYALLSSV
jgi:hypothetical protein